MKLKQPAPEVVHHKNAADHNDSTFGMDAPNFNPTFQLKQDKSLKFSGKESFETNNSSTENFSFNPPPFQLKDNLSPNPKPGNAISSPTQLPENIQKKMESSFNSDFSDVKIHSGSEEASSLGAQAFAKGNEVHFAPGKYNPQSQSGQHH